MVLKPEHARIIATAGWTKRDVQLFLFDHARRDRSELVGRTTSRPPGGAIGRTARWDAHSSRAGSCGAAQPAGVGTAVTRW